MYNFAKWVLIGVLTFAQGMCPDGCSCTFDDRKRRMVVCSEGGLRDLLDIGMVDCNVEVLKISAPMSAPNFLTIGPIFQEFSRLEEVHIVGSNIPAIGRHSFYGIPTLRVLNLRQNNISHILEHNFRGLVNLEYLHLDDNQIESMPSETFRHLQELKVLTLARNKIHELGPRIFLMLGRLHELDLSQNPLKALNPEVFKDIQGLKVFRCKFCHLSEVDNFIYRFLLHLTELDLRGNNLKNILTKEFHSMPKLETVNLEGNQLSILNDNAFVRVANSTSKVVEGPLNLRVVNLSKNRLTRVTSHAFANLTGLRMLDLSFNKLNALEPGTFLSIADSLRILNVSGNSIPLNQLKVIIRSMPKLSYLSVSDMDLSELPTDLFSRQENLKFVNLSGNNFFHLSPYVLGSIPAVETLDLSRNRFRGLTEKVTMHLEKIPNLMLTGNPWSCDLCRIPSILNRVNSSKMGRSFKGLICEHPHALAGRLISTLRGDELLWCTAGEFWDGDEKTSALGIPIPLLPAKVHPTFILGLLALIFLILSLAFVVASITYSRRRNDHYCTGEEQHPTDSAFQNSFAVDESNGNRDLSIAKKISDLPKQIVSIATIDEIVKYQESNFLFNDIL